MWNAVSYFETLTGKLKATKGKYAFCRVTGISYLEEVLDKQKTSNAFLKALSIALTGPSPSLAVTSLTDSTLILIKAEALNSPVHGSSPEILIFSSEKNGL